MRFYLSGQRGFDNRGCEAIIRSTVGLVRERFPDAEFLVPSDDLELDRRQWPDAVDQGVRFVPSHPPSFVLTQIWTRALDRVGILAPLVLRMPTKRALVDDIRSCDAVLSTGGDIYSLDYRAPARIATIDAIAMRLGKPVFMWCASVGPFEKAPALSRVLVRHLSRFSRIYVREDISLDYLQGKGLLNVERTSDPAFHLARNMPAAIDLEPSPGGRLIGINLSPIAHAATSGSGPDLYTEMARFAEAAVGPADRLFVIPHVSPLTGEGRNDDRIANGLLVDRLSPELRQRTTIVPNTLNATEYKAIIARLDLLVAARTHATIAAFSSGVPTISLAYSIKARGLNRDVFGHEDFVIPITEATCDALLRIHADIRRDEAAIRSRMADACERLRAYTRASITGIVRFLSPDARDNVGAGSTPSPAPGDAKAAPSTFSPASGATETPRLRDLAS